MAMTTRDQSLIVTRPRDVDVTARHILSDDLDRAMAEAVCDKLDDGTFSGRIPSCRGVLAFATSLSECQDELRSVLEDWILVGLKLGHALPVIDGLDLNATAEELLKEGQTRRKPSGLAGASSLASLAGTWTEKDEQGFREATAAFEQIDQNLWK